MYHKLLLSIFIFLSYFTVANGVEFTKGDYYIEIKGNLSKGKEVTEFFSFYCPHCFKQEPLMNELIALLPADATFKKNHVDNMPGQNLLIEQALTKALITADILKVKEIIVPAIFKYIHTDKAKFYNEKDIKNIFLIHGVDENAFDKTFASFHVANQFKKMQKKTKYLRQQGIGSVPTLIINGRYKPLTNNIKSMDEYKKLISYLLNKKV
ncbi:MAG: thiol:disulfide interchange protein DsbA/DsbL [Litorilituus sp.]|nr:thiol:disulfide interchange protein DsbA/DsbL [Litorilituus sp.]